MQWANMGLKTVDILLWQPTVGMGVNDVGTVEPPEFAEMFP